MSIPLSLRIKRLLAIGLPVIICDILVNLSLLDFGNDRWFTIAAPMRDCIDIPHSMYVPPIIMLFMTAVLVWFLEKDIIYTKLLVAKTTLFAAIGYLSWYEFGLFAEQRPPQGFLNFQIYFLNSYFLVLINLPIFFIIFKSENLKQRIIKTALVGIVEAVVMTIMILFRAQISSLWI